MSLGCFGPIDEKVLEQILQNKKGFIYYMKVDLSDKQCAKKHKKFFISLHFPLHLYFSLFLEARKEREKP